ALAQSMATMPKCSGPTLWTRGTSWPLGLSKTKVLRALACLGFRDRDMGNSFRVRGTIILNPKGRKGKKESFFLRLPPYHGFNGELVGAAGQAASNTIGLDRKNVSTLQPRWISAVNHGPMN